MIIRTELNRDKFEIHHYQDISDILRSNKEMAKGDGWDESHEHRHLARIPTLAYYKMIQKYPDIMEGDWRSKQRSLYKALKDPEFEMYQLRHE